jgi:hypothetical protein
MGAAVVPAPVSIDAHVDVAAESGFCALDRRGRAGPSSVETAGQPAGRDVVPRLA